MFLVFDLVTFSRKNKFLLVALQTDTRVCIYFVQIPLVVHVTPFLNSSLRHAPVLLRSIGKIRRQKTIKESIEKILEFDG